MRRILHYFKVRRRAVRMRRLADDATNAVRTRIINKDLYNDDGDLGYC